MKTILGILLAIFIIAVTFKLIQVTTVFLFKMSWKIFLFLVPIFLIASTQMNFSDFFTILILSIKNYFIS